MFPLCSGGNGGSKKLSHLPIDSQMPLPRLVIIHSTNIYWLPSVCQPFILRGEKLPAFSGKSSVPHHSSYVCKQKGGGQSAFLCPVGQSK